MEREGSRSGSGHVATGEDDGWASEQLWRASDDLGIGCGRSYDGGRWSLRCWGRESSGGIDRKRVIARACAQ